MEVEREKKKKDCFNIFPLALLLFCKGTSPSNVRTATAAAYSTPIAECKAVTVLGTVIALA